MAHLHCLSALLRSAFVAHSDVISWYVKVSHSYTCSTALRGSEWIISHSVRLTPTHELQDQFSTRVGGLYTGLEGSDAEKFYFPCQDSNPVPFTSYAVATPTSESRLLLCPSRQNNPERRKQMSLHVFDNIRITFSTCPHTHTHTHTYTHTHTHTRRTVNQNAHKRYFRNH